jgi:hypothetical protein
MKYINMDDVEELLGLASEKQIVFDYWIAYYGELKRSFALLEHTFPMNCSNEQSLSMQSPTFLGLSVVVHGR